MGASFMPICTSLLYSVGYKMKKLVDEQEEDRTLGRDCVEEKESRSKRKKSKGKTLSKYIIYMYGILREYIYFKHENCNSIGRTKSKNPKALNGEYSQTLS